MARFTVGSVPYVNAVPLTHFLPELGVDVRFAVPSELPAMLENGEAQAVLVSSVDALRVPERRMASGVCIGSDGPVKSVRLFSKVPFAEIRSLAWDSSSMTSNRLALVLLSELYGVQPEVQSHHPDLHRMLETCDACVLIGDIGMLAEGEGLHIMDMGSAWTDLTGLPFVWAAWIGKEGLTTELADRLAAGARKASLGKGAPATTTGDGVIHAVEQTSGWPAGAVADYYREVMVYDMDDRMLQGLRKFAELLQKNGFDDCAHFPSQVGS